MEWNSILYNVKLKVEDVFNARVPVNYLLDFYGLMEE